MSVKKHQERLEMDPPGYFEIMTVAFFGFLLVALGLYFGIRYDSLVRILVIPISFFLAIGLIIFISYKIHIIRGGKLNSIIFSSVGIIIENHKFDVLTTIPWEKVTSISISNSEGEKQPKVVQILSVEHVEIIDLGQYSSIFTPESELWNNINTIYQKFVK